MVEDGDAPQICRQKTHRCTWPATTSIPKDAGGSRAHCQVRIYLPDDVLDAPVVICSELPNNTGGSILL
jgi:hypothetical protein